MITNLSSGLIAGSGESHWIQTVETAQTNVLNSNKTKVPSTIQSQIDVLQRICGVAVQLERQD